MMKRIFLFFILLLSVIGFGQAQNEFAAIDKQISSIPVNATTTTDAIADYINRHFKTDNEKIRAAFYWTASTISYDVVNRYAVKDKETYNERIKHTLQTKKGVCLNYAEVFNEIANKVGIKALLIEGYTRQIGTTEYIPHAWCAAKMDNKWYVFDPTWGSGYMNKNKFVRKINNSYFKAEPGKMITTHMPFDYLWQFLNYPVTNEEFYAGKTQVNASKKYFDFMSEIPKYEKQSEQDKLKASLERMEKNGVKNTMISDRVTNKKNEIEYYNQKNVIADLNYIVMVYNEGIIELNQFIDYKNKQFKPMASDDEIKKMIASPKNKFLVTQELLSKLGQIDKNNLASLNSVKKSLGQSIKQVTEHESFVNEYLGKSKGARKSMFYRKTLLGVPLN